MKKVFKSCFNGEHKTENNSAGSKCLSVELTLKTTINYQNENSQMRIFSIQTELVAEVTFKNKGSAFWGRADTDLIFGAMPQKFNPGKLNFANGNWIAGGNFCTINYQKDGSVNNSLTSQTIEVNAGSIFPTSKGKFSYILLNSTLFPSGTVGELTNKSLNDFRADFVTSGRNLFITSIETCSYGIKETNLAPWGVLIN